MASYATVDDNVETGIITVTFEGGEAASINVDSLEATMKRRASIHGVKQKLVDSYAGAKKAVEDGEYESAEEFAKEQVARIIEQLSKGEWTSKREGGGPRVTLMAQAVSQVLGITVEQATEKLTAMDDDTKKTVSKSPKVALALARLRRESEERREAKLKEEAAKVDGASDDKLLAAFA